MFIRTKKIKGNEYAYIVENKWARKKVRQRVKKYLGRVYKFQKTQDAKFLYNTEEYIKKCPKLAIIKELIKIELQNHDFRQTNNIWQKDNCIVDLNSLKIRNTKEKPVALAFNNGFLTEFAVKKLINLKITDEKGSYLLAKAFVEAGLNIPKELFISYFNKFFK